MHRPASPHIRPLSGLSPSRSVLVLVGAGTEWGIGLAWLDAAVARLRASGLLDGDARMALCVADDGGSGRPVLAAMLDRSEPDAVRCRVAEAVALLQAQGQTACSVVMSGLGSEMAQAAAEGVLSANYRFRSSGPARDPRAAIDDLDFVVDDDAAAGLRAGWLTSLATLSARHLATEPANALTPPVFVDRCRELAAQGDFRIAVMGREALRAAGMEGLLTVASGSRHEPFLVRMDWRPAGEASDAKPLVLVGKTVTFDSGGISLKKAEDMDHMKADMGGGAAVFGAMAMIAELKPRFPVTAIFAVVENMPGPDAMRPSDVIRMASGATVEIINTDAEGRLILADALHYAAGLLPAAVIDLATLTGASLGIFGPLGIGTFANDEAWFERLVKADRMAGEKVWRLPLWPEYRQFLKSPVADLRNFSTTGQSGSTPIAAAFLSHFVGAHPWLHLDLYNTCWNGRSTPLMPQGPTGSGARVVAQLILDLDKDLDPGLQHERNTQWASKSSIRPRF